MPETPPCPLCQRPKPQLMALPVGPYFHCAHCDLRFLDPAARLTVPQEHSRYLMHRNDPADAAYQAFLEPLLQAMQGHISIGAHGLDFGAGPAPVLAGMFNAAGFKTEIYDPFFAPDETKLAAEYDFVLASEVAEHFYQPAREFALFGRLLKPGATLGLMTLRTDGVRDFAGWHYRRDPTHVVFYSRKTFAWIAEQFGFTDLRFYGERVVTLRRPS